MRARMGLRPRILEQFQAKEKMRVVVLLIAVVLAHTNGSSNPGVAMHTLKTMVVAAIIIPVVVVAIN
eukprot:8288162-Alexandrium_andersonii.AAC.1